MRHLLPQARARACVIWHNGGIMLTLFASDISPIAAEWQAGLFSLLSIIALVLGILAYFKRKPPLDAELVQLRGKIESLQNDFAELREELAVSKKAWGDSTREIFAAVNTLRDAMNAEMRGINRELGAISATLKEYARHD